MASGKKSNEKELVQLDMFSLKLVREPISNGSTN